MVQNLDLLVDSFDKYVVRPINAFGLGGFVFDVEGDTTVTLSSEITDHYLEDNSPVQDHISVQPKKVTLNTYVGELVFQRDDQSSGDFVQKVARKLTVLNSFLPDLSNAAKQIVDGVKNSDEFSLENVTLESVNKATDYYAFVKNISPPVNRQEQAYLYFKALQEGKFLVSVQTPFEFMNNMAIESIVAEQPEGSRFISNFSITLKQIRKVSILNTTGNGGSYFTKEFEDSDIFQGRSFYQQQELTQVGNMSGLPVDPLAAHAAARELRADQLQRLTVEDIEGLL